MKVKLFFQNSVKSQQKNGRTRRSGGGDGRQASGGSATGRRRSAGAVSGQSEDESEDDDLSETNELTLTNIARQVLFNRSYIISILNEPYSLLF